MSIQTRLETVISSLQKGKENIAQAITTKGGAV
jgi:hypothetical protein